MVKHSHSCQLPFKTFISITLLMEFHWKWDSLRSSQKLLEGVVTGLLEQWWNFRKLKKVFKTFTLSADVCRQKQVLVKGFWSAIAPPSGNVCKLIPVPRSSPITRTTDCSSTKNCQRRTEVFFFFLVFHKNQCCDSLFCPADGTKRQHKSDTAHGIHTHTHTQAITPMRLRVSLFDCVLSGFWE